MTNVVIAVALFTIALSVTSIRSDIVKEASPSVNDICGLLPDNSMILRPNSCTNWIRCPTEADAHDFEEGTCVFGLHFNKDVGKCQFADEVQCPFDAKPLAQNQCVNRNDGVFLADHQSNDCRGYVFCKNGQEMKSSCPGDLIFNPEKSACVYKQEYECPVAVAKNGSDPICRSIRSGIMFAHQHDCTMYHSCANGALNVHTCDHDMAFDHKMGQCVSKTEVVCLPTAKEPEPDLTVCGTANRTLIGPQPDEESCSGYYVCARMADNTPDRQPKHVKCSSGFFYDAEHYSCRDRLNVKCKLDRCEGLDNKYVNVDGDCATYARCQNGRTVQTGRCPDKYNFDERSQGCVPQVINYAACSAY